VENASGFTPTDGPRIIGTDPMLGPLADNGGRTQTHALLAGSPAIDAGELGIANPPMFDQRGPGFPRIVDGNGDTFSVIDIGAYEYNPGGPALLGDYNMDGRVNAADYVLWRNTEGDTVAPYGGADGNGNGMIDAGDYQVWRDNYGNTLPPASGNGQDLVISGKLAALAVATESVIPFASTGHAATTGLRNSPVRLHSVASPSAIDAALLVLLANNPVSIMHDDVDFTSLAEPATNRQFDDLFASPQLLWRELRLFS
jgi:hypothetical protein